MQFEQLLAIGLTPDAIMVRVRRGQLHPLHRGTYAVGHANPTREGWMLAAVRACGADAVLSHFSAAALPKVIGWEDRYPDVLVLGENPPRHPRIIGHRTSFLPPEHVTTVRGIPATTVERTLLDLLLRGGFAHPLVNAPLYLAGRRIIPDFRWGDLVLEADGAFHDDPFERVADRERQAILEFHGFRVIRVTWALAVARPGRTLRRCEAAGAPRAVDRSASA